MEEEKQRFHCLKCKRTGKTMTSFTARYDHTYHCKNDKDDIYECPGHECGDCPFQSKFSDLGPGLNLRFGPELNLRYGPE